MLFVLYRAEWLKSVGLGFSISGRTGTISRTPMTEIDWQTTATGANDMLRYIRTRTTSRKLQLLMCAACRTVLDHLPAARVLPILQGIERYAEGFAPLDTFRQAQLAAQLLDRDADREPNQASPYRAATLALLSAVSSPLDDGLGRMIGWVEAVAARDAGEGLARAARVLRHRQLCDLFREVLGNPFAPRTAVPTWMQAAERSPPGWLIRVSEAARNIAVALHRDQAYDRFPILADSLEEEGCTDDELLLHMRQPHQHVRGCWALDLILGKN